MNWDMRNDRLLYMAYAVGIDGRDLEKGSHNRLKVELKLTANDPIDYPYLFFWHVFHHWCFCRGANDDFQSRVLLLITTSYAIMHTGISLRVGPTDYTYIISLIMYWVFAGNPPSNTNHPSISRHRFGVFLLTNVKGCLLARHYHNIIVLFSMLFLSTVPQWVIDVNHCSTKFKPKQWTQWKSQTLATAFNQQHVGFASELEKIRALFVFVVGL